MPPTLARQLALAARVIESVMQGRSLADALPRIDSALRPGVQALVFHGLRHAGESRALVARLAPRPPAGPVAALLGLALSLLRPGAGYAPHTVVDQAVEAAAQLPKGRAAAGFVNACLRRYLREAQALQQAVAAQPEARWNHPAWWITRLQADHPDHWREILEASQSAAPLVLRVNRRRLTRAAYAQQLADAGIACTPIGEDGLRLARALPVERLPGFAAGDCSVQDAGAQLAAPLLLSALSSSLPAGASVPPSFELSGARVLDACAAPGGKTAHLLERAALDLLAIDVDERRCERIRDNLQRLGLRAEVRGADAAQPAAWWDGRPFDAILLDAPCTASGIVRRHPDVRWLRRPGDVAQLAAQQARLLEALWPLLRPGGVMLYCTCSVFHAEGQDPVRAFLSRHTDALLEPSPGHLLPGGAGAPAAMTDNVPGEHGWDSDGFYYALLRRR